MKHSIKTWSIYFNRVVDGDKTFEVRKNDRDYQAGDELQLLDYDPVADLYTGCSCICTILYILHGPQFGIEAGYCVMSIQKQCVLKGQNYGEQEL